jgi:DNA-binding LacI/PurR family transcriptional regulator
MDQRNLVVVATNFAFSFPVKMLGYIKNNVRQGQDLVHYSTLMRADAEGRRLRSILTRPGPLALIGIGVRPDPAIMEAYKAARVPIVLVDEEAPGASTVACNNVQGGYIAGEHLASAGRQRIGVICGKTDVKGGYNAVKRLNGLRSALDKRRLSLPPEHIIEVMDYSYADGVQAMTKFLDGGRRLDAVFVAAGDDCAMGVLKVTHERGIKVPEDIAILGYDDRESAQFSTPSLTTVRQPLERIANAAYTLASAIDSRIVDEPKTIYFDSELIRRQSA